MTLIPPTASFRIHNFIVICRPLSKPVHYCSAALASYQYKPARFMDRPPKHSVRHFVQSSFDVSLRASLGALCNEQRDSTSVTSTSVSCIWLLSRARPLFHVLAGSIVADRYKLDLTTCLIRLSGSASLIAQSSTLALLVNEMGD